MQWLFDNCARLGVKVACMSFGADPLVSADPLKAGAEMLSRRGITVVCASGNSGAGSLKSPGVSPEVITVGAVDTYALMTGTSVSAPYVAGACCLLHERYKALTPREAKRMIVASSVVRDGVRVFVL